MIDGGGTGLVRVGDLHQVTPSIKQCSPLPIPCIATRCPGSMNPSQAGMFHYVVLPDGIVDLRRHWHRGCWEREAHRRGISPW